MKKYISDFIDNEYGSWTNEDIIFLSSPTGTGKTTFIFDKFLPYMKNKKKRILYLVNRSVLKKQLDKRHSNLPFEHQNYIYIESYQSIESILIQLAKTVPTPEYLKGYITSNYNITGNKTFPYNIKREDLERHLSWLASFDCVVCDESHYFLSDSNFNKNTILSYNFIKWFYGSKLKIFISATIEDIKSYICDGAPFNWGQRTPWFSLWNAKPLFLDQPIKDYACERNYDYLKIHFFYNLDAIIKQIIIEKGKWLIFVDSKEKGQKIKKKINDCNEKNNQGQNAISVAFVTADYDSELDASSEVQSIVTKEQQSADILIATSVLDNGINLSDGKLRKIVIMADNETEFIQMLGRRRADSENVDVYAFLYDKAHFKSRINTNNMKKRCAESFYKKLLFMMENKAANQTCTDFFTTERNMMIEHSRSLVDNIFETFEQIKYTHLSYNGMLFLNPLAMKNLQNLNLFFERVLRGFESGDEYAFAKEVLNWLNKSSDTEIENILVTSYESSIKHLCEEFDAKCNIKMEKADLIELKGEIINDLKLILAYKKEEKGQDYYKKKMKDLGQNDRPLSVPFMRELTNMLDLPYTMIVENGCYTIIKKE